MPVIFGSMGNEGIYACEFNPDKGEWNSPATLAFAWKSPGVLIHHPRLDVIYSSGAAPGSKQPQVAALSTRDDGSDASASLINSHPSDGVVTHMAVHESGDFLVTVQYGAGSVAVYPLDDQGRIGERQQLILHEEGFGGNDRQEKAHPHYVTFDPSGKFILIPDLGANAVFVYKLMQEGGQLVLHEKVEAWAGAGPRHMKFSPDGRFAWVLNELNSTVDTYSWKTGMGELKFITSIDTLPAKVLEKEAVNSASEIRVHPSGRFLFTGNRGNDSITVFKIDPENGSLERVEVEPVRGSWPRNFAIDPSGHWLICANQHSSNIGIFEIDQDSGELTYKPWSSIQVPEPTWVLFPK
ncbi:lactonase family protein [Puniceicoccales bacterium CK1056]|uniref:Lactonase family protein n=1 Tax=Oceanipulchritudo coccoides TaxID=2706888 RepID=A0A6B2M4Y2_9BACT|nr:lactonase family protein [Oceanipulchritudo coccoides]NDV63342.1 lactonase family protein [Oceanipulchritudo coccoides]